MTFIMRFKVVPPMKRAQKFIKKPYLNRYGTNVSIQYNNNSMQSLRWHYPNQVAGRRKSPSQPAMPAPHCFFKILC